CKCDPNQRRQLRIRFSQQPEPHYHIQRLRSHLRGIFDPSRACRLLRFVLSWIVSWFGGQQAWPPALGSAFYILFADDVNNPSWPQGFDNNAMCVVQPQNFTADMFAKIKRTVPNSRSILYWDAWEMPFRVEGQCATGHIMGDRPGRNCSTSYQCGPGAWG